jgi:hypothetical protein
METPLPEYFILHSLAHLTRESHHIVSNDDYEPGTAFIRAARGVENDEELKEVGVA